MQWGYSEVVGAFKSYLLSNSFELFAIRDGKDAKNYFYAPLTPLTLNNYFYRPLRSKGKVMFLHLSMIVFTGRSLSRGVSVQAVSLSRGCLCQGSLCPGSLCPGGFLSRGALSRRVSVQGGLCPGGSLSGGLCLGSLCLGGLCPVGSLSGGLCLGFSVWGSLSGGSLSRGARRMVMCGWYASYWNAFTHR